MSLYERYGFYCFVRGYSSIVKAVADTEAVLRSRGRPAAASLLVQAYGELRNGLKDLEREQALFGTKVLREMEARTRVRPDTQGGGGPRLGNYLTVDPIGSLIDLPGSIGVADYDLLDSNVEWWPTNEWGSSAQVGRRIYGTFYGADSAGPPDRGEERTHPLFQPGKNETLSGYGTISEPIPARHFIERAIPIIKDRWDIEFSVLKARYDARLALVATTQR